LALEKNLIIKNNGLSLFHTSLPTGHFTINHYDKITHTLFGGIVAHSEYVRLPTNTTNKIKRLVGLGKKHHTNSHKPPMFLNCTNQTTH
jgi:hypothetical protein